MSLRSTWTKLTSYAQPLKNSFQNLLKGTQPRAIPATSAYSAPEPNGTKTGAVDGLEGHGKPAEASLQTGISGELLKPTQDLRDGNLKRQNKLNGLASKAQEGHGSLQEAKCNTNRTKSGDGALDQGSSSGPVDSSTTTTKRRKREKKKQGSQQSSLKPDALQGVKVAKRDKPLGAPSPIDNLLQSISDPRFGSLGLPIAAEPKKSKNSKVTIDALLESIPVSKTNPSKVLPEEAPTKGRSLQGPVAYRGEETPKNEEYVNIAKTSSAWNKKSISRAYHILCLDNCGLTMIKSDIERIFANYHARRFQWDFTVVPARTNIRLMRKNRYYLYFNSDEAAQHHLAHFSQLMESEKGNGRLPTTTLPPPASAQTFLESKPADLDLGSEALRGSAASVSKYCVPNLFLVNPLKMPLYGVIPNLLYQVEGAPGRTVLVSLCANSHWQVLQVWLKHSLIEKYGFGRWLVSGGDIDGRGVERIPIVGPNTPEPLQGGRWVVRFRDGYPSEAERLVREWDGQWVNIRGRWGRLRAEVLW
ncbi:hypothetical protein TWF481_009081 [Arthrobotrys musiformis]|uniref:RRM domain-containing protein n=1 Tax=Arthrobotrys musiformis TaxID=47236 RepID=A0AAV9W598_9PEZI